MQGADDAYQRVARRGAVASCRPTILFRQGANVTDQSREPAASAAPLTFSRKVPLIVAAALFMENIDASVLATSLPEIARDLGTNPLNLKLALTSYLLALTIFIPGSGWAADRFGARLVFRLAIVVFAAGSLACSCADSLWGLVAARVLQGAGGAMMTPVGRLIVLRATPKAGFVKAMAWLTVPALLGPVIGPVLGGFITTHSDWRWIFWINIPIAVVGLTLASIFIPDIRGESGRDFDGKGFLLLGPGLALSLTGVTLAGTDLVLPGTLIIMLVAGPALLAGYVLHALRSREPLVDLRLLRLPTFSGAIVGGTVFRAGSGALPFILPLMLQVGFGLTPLQSGMLTFASGLGAIAMKFLAQPILQLIGFRRALTVNALLAGGLLFLPAFFMPGTPWLLMTAVLFLGGLSRSLQFTSINAIAYADVPADRLSSATSFSAVMQELSGSIGVTLAALALEAVQRLMGGDTLAIAHFPWAFALVAFLTSGSALVFARLAPDAGAVLIPVQPGRQRRPVAHVPTSSDLKEIAR